MLMDTISTAFKKMERKKKLAQKKRTGFYK